MTSPVFADRQDLLQQRRLERGLPPEPKAPPSARSLLLTGGSVGAGVLVLVLASWVLISLRDRLVSNEIARMSAIPAQLQALETQLRTDKGKLDQISKSNAGLAQGLVAVSSGSALITQLGQIAPQGVQITEATVSGPSLSLKGRSDDPGSFTRVNAFSLLLAYAPLFKPDAVRVIKLSREPVAAAANAPAPTPSVSWDLAAGFATLKPAEQLALLRKLGADGMAKRLQDLARLGVLP
ncbi:MAG: hypothetical protein ACO3EF_05815 [Vulcanococcus sp.]